MGNTPDGIFLGIPGDSGILIVTRKSGQQIREFARCHLSQVLKDKSTPIDELVDNSGIVIRFNGEVELLSCLATTPGGRYLKFDRNKNYFVGMGCSAIPEGVRYSGQTIQCMYDADITEDGIRNLAQILREHPTIRTPEDMSKESIERVNQAREVLAQFVDTYS